MERPMIRHPLVTKYPPIRSDFFEKSQPNSEFDAKAVKKEILAVFNSHFLHALDSWNPSIANFSIGSVEQMSLPNGEATANQLHQTSQNLNEAFMIFHRFAEVSRYFGAPMEACMQSLANASPSKIYETLAQSDVDPKQRFAQLKKDFYQNGSSTTNSKSKCAATMEHFAINQKAYATVSLISGMLCSQANRSSLKCFPSLPRIK
jgi:hypothetical protein